MSAPNLVAEVESALAIAHFKRGQLFKPWTWFGSDYDIQIPSDGEHIDLIATLEGCRMFATVLKARGFHAEVFSTAVLGRAIHKAVVARTEQHLYWALHYYGWSYPQVFVHQDGGYRKL